MSLMSDKNNEQQSDDNIKPLLEIFRCALGEDEHIYKEPITLSCGHCICKSCIPEIKDKLTCKICGDENKTNLNDLKVSACMQFFIQSNVEKLICLTKQELKNLSHQLEGKISLKINLRI